MDDNQVKETLQFDGYKNLKKLPNGRWVGILKMLHTTGLFIMDEERWFTRYCYEHEKDAVAAVIEWDGTGDPPGPWIKQKPEDRHNPNLKWEVENGKS